MIVGGPCQPCADWYQCDLYGGCLRPTDAGYLPASVMWDDDLTKARKRIAALEAEVARLKEAQS